MRKPVRVNLALRTIKDVANLLLDVAEFQTVSHDNMRVRRIETSLQHESASRSHSSCTINFLKATRGAQSPSKRPGCTTRHRHYVPTIAVATEKRRSSKLQQEPLSLMLRSERVDRNALKKIYGAKGGNSERLAIRF